MTFDATMIQPLQGTSVGQTQDNRRTDVGQTQDNRRTDVGQTQDSKTYKFTDLAVLLEEKADTLRKWWARDLSIAYQHCHIPLQVVVKTTKTGTPVYEFTEAGIEAFRLYKSAKDRPAHMAAISRRYPAPTQQTDVVEAEITDYSAIVPVSHTQQAVALNVNVNIYGADDFETDVTDLISGSGSLAGITDGLRQTFAAAGKQTGKELAVVFLQNQQKAFTSVVTGVAQATIDGLGKS